ncbi:FAD-dependent oxidoreductase [Irregularibacter muris]|uniref:FAD-dependent oxidoreductase n=1 Tax=Irregularibacter muris TaxID=1796619 RepID=A0AAE3HGH9_9FIRM|nr:FAD-dependent oxidoreductase [Irregularibacter muris]MCR1900177.1 FAD-dependent oxidoreductase [Irregularibacter muris]
MKLLKKGYIGKLELKNRVYMAPMGTATEPDGSFSDRAIRYYEERAIGGTGLIITGANQVTLKYEAKACNVLESPRSFEQLNFLARRIHYNDAKLCIQITPGLGRMQFTTGDVVPYSASNSNAFWFPEVKCKPYSIGQIKELVKKMGEGAAKVKAAGADAVELHGYGGYLMDQFQSTLWNKRKDEYGGDLKGRMKFSLECISEIKKTCGKDFPVLFKFTPYHGVEGGRELEEGIEMAKILETAGVDALHVDVGCYEAWYKAINTVYQESPTQIHIAAEIKKHVNIPILSQGKLYNPDLAEDALEKEKADFIGLGHQSLADPQWVNKVQKNESYDIVPCLGCNECLYAGFTGKIIHCAVNPHCFAEDYYPITEAKENKRILVIGGGPGGMVAALTAAERGLEVELWEKTNQLGGTLLAAGGPSFKQDVMNYVKYLEGKIHRSNINLKLMKEGTADEVLRGDYDKVILATGSRAFMPPINGIDSEKVVTANDILTGKVKYGKDVVVIGGGLVGCETAAFCAEKTKNVTIIEMLEDILVTASHCENNDQALRQLVKDSEIDIVSNAKVSKISNEEIEYTKDDKSYSTKADTYIVAAGYVPNDELFDELNGKVNVSKIGDAVVPDKILTAVHQGFHIARNL